MRSRGVWLALIVLAAALRFPQLASRPMHADEGVHADKFGTLLEGGGYRYDPSDYHGPSLSYLTLPSAWFRGARRYTALDEVTLRLVPAAFGVALVAAHLWARAFLGASGALAAALLAALSPAMVFYSRYYIHETPLVFFSFGLLLAGLRYARRPGAVPAALAGICLGLMQATKETALLVLGALAGALVLAGLLERWRGSAGAEPPIGWRGRDLALALVAAVAVSGLLYSSFLGHPTGVVDALRSLPLSADRALRASEHQQPWDYYLGLLVHVPAKGTPFWTEGLILLLALVGGAAAWSSGGTPGADGRVLRFLSLDALLLLVLYSAVPYKTPWCVLGILQAMVLLAGAGAVFLVRACRGRAGRWAVTALLVLAASQLGWQAFGASFRFASDPRNPYVYGHTGKDVFEIAGRVRGLAGASPDGLALPIAIIGRENLWPLPWYLRGLTGVQWWNAVPEAAGNTPLVLATPDGEPALARQLYDLRPPGERELYVPIFERPLELRPGVELRGYAALSLWEEYRRAEAGGLERRP